MGWAASKPLFILDWEIIRCKRLRVIKWLLRYTRRCGGERAHHTDRQTLSHTNWTLRMGKYRSGEENKNIRAVFVILNLKNMNGSLYGLMLLIKHNFKILKEGKGQYQW